MSCTVCHSESNVIWGTTTVNGKQALVLNNPSLGFKKVCLGCLGGKGDTALGNGVELLKEQMRAMRQEFEGYIDQLKTQICDLNKDNLKIRELMFEAHAHYGRDFDNLKEEFEKFKAVPAPAPEPEPMEEESAPQPPATRGRRSTRVSKSKQ